MHILIPESFLVLTVAAEYEFFQYKAPVDEGGKTSVAKFLQNNQVSSLPPLTEGNFGYNLIRPLHNQDYFYGIFDACEKFNCALEGWHTETGPGVFEAALAFGEISQMADKAALFKYGSLHIPCVCNLLIQQICHQSNSDPVRHNTLLHGQTASRLLWQQWPSTYLVS